MFVFDSHYRFILPGAEDYFDFKAQEEEAKAAINHIIENDLPVFVADWSNDAYDCVFVNVPSLKIRFFNKDIITEHLGEDHIFGDRHRHQNEVFSMFGFSLSNAPAPTPLDAWEHYKKWMKHLLKDSVETCEGCELPTAREDDAAF